jgi:hypothetical protein
MCALKEALEMWKRQRGGPILAPLQLQGALE